GPDHALVHDVAADRVVGDAPTDALDRCRGEGEQRRRPLRAQLIEQRLLAQRIAGEDETAIAAGCAEAHLLTLQQHYIPHAALGQPECGVETGKTTADD